jgi:hypothetical protein
MNIIRNIRTPIMHRAVEANGFVFVGGTIADDTSVAMGEQTRVPRDLLSSVRALNRLKTMTRHAPRARLPDDGLDPSHASHALE